MLTLRPRELHEALVRARAEQRTETWKGKYALRAGGRAPSIRPWSLPGAPGPHRGLPKVRLQHAFAATALNLVRLHKWWTSSPLQSVRKASHLTRLGHALAA